MWVGRLCGLVWLQNFFEHENKSLTFLYIPNICNTLFHEGVEKIALLYGGFSAINRTLHEEIILNLMHLILSYPVHAFMQNSRILHMQQLCFAYAKLIDKLNTHLHIYP